MWLTCARLLLDLNALSKDTSDSSGLLLVEVIDTNPTMESHILRWIV